MSDGQLDADARALADGALHGDGAAVRVDDALRQRQAQSEAACRPRAAPVHAKEEAEILGR